MQRIKIEEAEEGMVLAKPVLSEQGTVLCSEGAELSEVMISTLKKRDIVRLKVVGHPIERPDEKPLDELLKDVSIRFSRVENDVSTLKIKKIISRQIKEEYGGQE